MIGVVFVVVIDQGEESVKVVKFSLKLIEVEVIIFEVLGLVVIDEKSSKKLSEVFLYS